MTTEPHPDPLDAVLREAKRRGQMVLLHPIAGPVLVAAVVDADCTTVAPTSLEAIARLDGAIRNAVATMEPGVLPEKVAI